MKTNDSVNDSLNVLVIKPSGIQPASLANVLTLTEESADFRKHIFFNATPATPKNRDVWNVNAQVHYSKNGIYRPKEKQIISPFMGMNEKQKDQIMYAVRDDYLRGLVYHGRTDKVPEVLKATGEYNDKKYSYLSTPKLVTTKSVLVPPETKQKKNPIKQYEREVNYLSVNVDHYQPKILQSYYWEKIKKIAKECGQRNIHPCQFSAVLTPVNIMNNALMPGEDIAEYFKQNFMEGKFNLNKYTQEQLVKEKLDFGLMAESFNIRMHTPKGSMQLFYMGAKDMVDFLAQAEAEFILPYRLLDERLDETEYTLSKIKELDPTHFSKLNLFDICKEQDFKYTTGPVYLEFIKNPMYKKNDSAGIIINGRTHLGLN